MMSQKPKPMKQFHKVTIEKEGLSSCHQIRHGLGLQALKEVKNTLEFDCQKADCGICIFKVLEGHNNLSEPTDPEKDFLKAMRAGEGERLACQVRVFGPVRIEVEDFNP